MKWQKYCYYVDNPDGSRSYYDYVNITNIKNYAWESNPSMYAAITAGGTVTVTNSQVEAKQLESQIYSAQFNTVMQEYDKLIGDSSYQGINLLNNGTLNVTFDENRVHSYTIQGQDVSTSGLGVSTADWVTEQDIKTSFNQMLNAINQIRSYNESLGNSYQIIQTRQGFTDGMIDLLETGADDLVLADMNEESAQYLMLQTRQQLAINSLSLASQAAQSVLKLF
ncbi:MAG: hypothetical protein MJ210_00390 [Alphaproteobacteria bacterium]|nr:hypothetical protein [Alphaproteobacteria bacterium]